MKWSEAEIAEFEAENFRKRVLYTEREELLRILSGERATDVYPKPSQRKGLRDRDILEVRYATGKYLAVSPEAEQLLISEGEYEPWMRIRNFLSLVETE